MHALFFGRPWTTPEIEDLLRRPDVVADAAVDGSGKHLFGFAISRALRPESELLTIAVDKRRQGCGVGRMLLGAHLARIESTGCDHIFLEVDEANVSALALYRSFGFQQVGERKGYYATKTGGRATALVMRAQLG